jgi:trans-aconitate 2-methyltransferase
MTEQPFADWDPDQYNVFATEREQPFWDLVDLLEDVEAPRLVDLGCGDGRLTSRLAARLGARRTIGIDNSAAMHDASIMPSPGDVQFELSDLSTWESDSEFDVVFSNAALHWAANHRAILRRWRHALDAGGQLVVQVPANSDHPIHLLASELASEILKDAPPDPVAANVLSPVEYAVALDELGFRYQRVRLEVYTHHLSAPTEAVEWIKGSTLNRFKEPMGASVFDEFVLRLTGLVDRTYGSSGSYLYTFKRILMWARLP